MPVLNQPLYQNLHKPGHFPSTRPTKPHVGYKVNAMLSPLSSLLLMQRREAPPVTLDCGRGQQV